MRQFWKLNERKGRIQKLILNLQLFLISNSQLSTRRLRSHYRRNLRDERLLWFLQLHTKFWRKRIESQKLGLEEIWWMMNCLILTVISCLHDSKRSKVQLEETHFQNPQMRKILKLMSDKERKNLLNSRFISRNFKRRKNSYERFKKKCERKKTSKACKRSWRRKQMLTRRNQTFRTNAFSCKSISEIKNLMIKEEISFQILIDTQTQWKFHMKGSIKWVWDRVSKEQITTWALFQLSPNKLD